MEFEAHKYGWIGEMHLKTEPPFSGWNQNQWNTYCAFGPYFFEKPHYNILTAKK